MLIENVRTTYTMWLISIAINPITDLNQFISESRARAMAQWSKHCFTIFIVISYKLVHRVTFALAKSPAAIWKSFGRIWQESSISWVQHEFEYESASCHSVVTEMVIYVCDIMLMEFIVHRYHNHLYSIWYNFTGA